MYKIHFDLMSQIFINCFVISPNYTLVNIYPEYSCYMDSMDKMPVGIDDLAIYIPKLYVDYKDFAEARGIDSTKARIRHWNKKDGFG